MMTESYMLCNSKQPTQYFVTCSNLSQTYESSDAICNSVCNRPTASFRTFCFAFLSMRTTAFGATKVENLHTKKLIYFHQCNLFLNHSLQNLHHRTLMTEYGVWDNSSVPDDSPLHSYHTILQ